MKRRGDLSQAREIKIQKILRTFSIPRTPGQVAKELSIQKFKTKPLLEKGLIKPLNPGARKGTLYVLASESRKYANPDSSGDEPDWPLIGWVLASPKQRLAILKTLVMDTRKKTSEEIRERASKQNPCLTRISTKDVLNELIRKGLVHTELVNRRRYYWISEMGKQVIHDIRPD